MRPALTVSVVVVALVVAYANAQCNAGNVAANAVLYHGTTIAAFARNWYSGKGVVPAGAYDTLYDSHPSGPAWFANTIGFAWHAGVRSMPAGGGKGYLNKYYAMVKIPVLDCATHADFYGKAPATNGYLQVNGYAGGPPAKDMAGALGFCANKAAHKFAGYIIQSDRVRGQPETILCEPDVWLNRFRRNQNGQDVVQVTVHGQGAAGNNHPKAGANAKARTLTWTHNGVNMRLWWPMTGFPALGDLVDTATGNQILLETKGKVSRAQRARGAAAAAKGPGPFAPNPLKNPDVKPEQEKIDYQVEVQVLDSARSAENNGAHPHWDDDDVPAPKFAQRRMRGRVSVSRVLQSME